MAVWIRATSSWWEWTKVALPVLAVTVAAFWLTWQFVRPAPPQRVVIATGGAAGHYMAVGRRYAERFAEAGIELEVRQTAGSVENYRLLLDPVSGVDAAIVQGGTLPPEAGAGGGGAAGPLSAVASIYLEPLWLFHRLDAQVTEITQLIGKRIAIGPDGSGTRALAMELAKANGITEAGDTRLLPLGGEDAVRALRAGEVDAAFFVIAPTSPVVADLLADPSLKLVSMERAEAYTRHFRYLHNVTLPQGAVDLAKDLPREDATLLAASAAIVVRADVHPSVVQLLVRAAQHVHRGGDLLSAPGKFPSDLGTQVAVSDQAAYFLRTPPNLLHRNLPFAVASLIDRLIILVIPLLVVLIPLVRIMPPVYRWRVRSRIYKWYARLRVIDEHLGERMGPEQAAADLDRLATLEREVAAVRVPLSYMQEFYNLRVHMGYMRGRLEARGGEPDRGTHSRPGAP